MRSVVSIIVLLSVLHPVTVDAQIITTIAGNGRSTNTGDGGPATSATIFYPIGGSFDKSGNYYFATGIGGNSVRQISSSGIISTVAGGGGTLGDGIQATSAQLNNVQGVTVDSVGNIFIAETGNNKIRKVDAATGIIGTITGNGTASFGGDGQPASAGMLNYPLDVCFDKSGNLYIADAGNNRVRKINTSGIITTFAGNGAGAVVSSSGDGGSATATGVGDVQGICADNSGNIYMAVNGWVRKVSPTDIIYTVAGTGTPGYSGNNGPAIAAEVDAEKITVDKFNNIYISEASEYTVREINVSGTIKNVAGDLTEGFGGDGGNPNLAELDNPSGVVTDTCGNLYIADADNNRVRKVTYPFCDYLSVGMVVEEQSLSVYPNPAYDVLNIDNLQAQTYYIVVNVVGVTQQTGILKVGSNSISVQGLSPGMYLLDMISESGEKVMKKIIKE